MTRKVEISHKTIIFLILFLLGLWFLYAIRDLLLELFVAILIVTILDPFVNLLSRIKIPRAISVLLVYILVFGILGTLVSVIAPIVVEQTTSFANALPGYLSNLGASPELTGQVFGKFTGQLGDVPNQVFKFTVSVLNNVVGLITVLVFTFYMLLGRNKLEGQLDSLFGEERMRKIVKFINNLESRLGKWARGQLFLMIVVGTITYLGLLLLKVPFALPLGILAGLLEIIPILGPIIAAIPSVIIGLGISPLTGLGTVVLAILVNQLENYILVPKIMEKSVGVSPIMVLIALAIGARFAGIVGIIISVPLVITIQVLIKEYLIKE